MNWFDFSDLSFLCLFIVVLTTVVFIIFASVTFIVIRKKDDKNNVLLRSESNTTHVYTIYLKKNMVVSFSRNNIRKKKIYDFDTFYSKFSTLEASRIRQWISDIENNKNTSSFLESKYVIKSSTKEVFALIKLISYKQDLNVIHLEMQLLRSITPEAVYSKKTTGSNFIGKQTFGTVSNAIGKSRSNKGYTFAIRFSFFNKLSFKDNREEKMMVLKLKDCIYPFANDKTHPRQLIEINEHEILIVDMRLSSRIEASQLAMSLQMYIKRTILLNDFEQDIKFTIGIVQNYQFFRDFKSIAQHAQEASLVADHENKEIYFYEKTAVPELSEDRYREQINNLIKQGNIRYLFRPIINVKKPEVFGYLQTIRTYGSSFASYNELIRYAALCGKSHDLFAVFAKNALPRFASEIVKSNTPLFYPVSIFDFEDITIVFPQISRIEKIHLVLVFEENEISQNVAHIDEIMDQLKMLKHMGYDVALSMMDKSLLLDTNFYKIFDYFIAGTSMTGELKKNNFSRLSLRSLIESLLKYKKIIIANDLEGWQSVELMIKSGVDYVSSEAISPYSELILPVEKKKLKKLKDLM